MSRSLRRSEEVLSRCALHSSRCPYMHVRAVWAYLWDYAEEHGVADRMVVVLGSDFGRTNFYNAVDGKDHWPIGSFIVMEKNQRWTGRAVGETVELPRFGGQFRAVVTSTEVSDSRWKGILTRDGR